MARPRVHDDTLRSRLLDVATRTLAEAGPDALTLRSTAAEAGTSTSAVYSLFGDRDGLVRAAAERAADRFAAHLRAVPRTADPRADLLALGVAYRRHALTEPQGYRLMFGDRALGSTGDGPAGVTDAPTFRVLHDAVRDALAAGAGPVEDAAALEAASALWALAHGLVTLELTGLLPLPVERREAAYRRALAAAGPALLAAAAGTPAPA